MGQGRFRLSPRRHRSPCLLRYPRPEPYCVTRLASEHDQPHIRSPPVAAAATNIPLAAGRAQEDETILENGFSGQAKVRFVHLDPPGLIRSWNPIRFDGISSGGLHHNAFDDDTGGYIFPERDQQLSRQRYNRRFAQAATVAFHPFKKPVGERRVPLMVRNQSQASWMSVVRSLGLPDFDTPCSRSTDPLCQGVGAKPA